MNNSELLKGLSMEELQERQEFTAALADKDITCECTITVEL
jgi:hypothetical protein